MHRERETRGKREKKMKWRMKEVKRAKCDVRTRSDKMRECEWRERERGKKRGRERTTEIFEWSSRAESRAGGVKKLDEKVCCNGRVTKVTVAPQEVLLRE